MSKIFPKPIIELPKAAVVIILVISITFTLGLFNFPEVAGGRDYYRPIANLENKALITDKYQDRKNHNYKTIELTVNDTVDCYYVLYGYLGADFFDFIQVNDSIIEFNSAFQVTIRRNKRDTILQLK